MLVASIDSSGAKGKSLALCVHSSAICRLTFAKYFILAFICTISFNSSYIKRISRSHTWNIGFISNQASVEASLLFVVSSFSGGWGRGSCRLLYSLPFLTLLRCPFHPFHPLPTPPSLLRIPFPPHPPSRTKNLCNPVLVASRYKNVAASAPVFRIVCSCVHPMHPRHHRQLVNQMQRSHREVNCSESQVAFEFPPEGL